jgi:membrane associated rhomboid family serine protease
MSHSSDNASSTLPPDENPFLNDNASSTLPPDENPFLKAYERFVRDTPFVTRGLLQLQVITWILSWFLDLRELFGSTVKRSLDHGETYRVLLSPFVCSSFFALIMCYLTFSQYGIRLERSVGSTAYAIFLATIGWTVTILHLLICIVMYEMVGFYGWLEVNCNGVWILIFGLLSFECSQAPATSVRRLFLCNVRTRYYPVALLVLMCFFRSFQLAYLLAIGVGYAYQRGFLDRLKVDPFRIQSWEQITWQQITVEGYLTRHGWVSSHAAGRRNRNGSGDSLEEEEMLIHDEDRV